MRIVRFAVLCSILAAVGTAQAPQRVTRDLKGSVEGAPEKARVRVTLWHNDMERSTIDPLAECFAAADGSFAFDGVAWFEKQLWGQHKVILVVRCGELIGVRELRGDKLALDDLRVALKKSIEIRGVLRDDETNKPIENAWVWSAIFGDSENAYQVWLTSPLMHWHARTDAEGRFVLKGLPDFDLVKLTAGGEDHARTWIDVEVEDRKDLKAWLVRGGRIQGTVLMPDGKPAGRVPVTATGTGYGRTLTDDHGRFTLSALGPGVYKVFAEVPDLTVIAVLNLKVEAGGLIEDQTVQLVHGGFIVGSIVDADTGKPIVPGQSTDVAMYGPARGSGGSCQCTSVLPDGTFRIRAPAGKNRIYLRGAMGWSEPSEEVFVVEGQETVVEWKVHRGKPRKK